MSFDNNKILWGNITWTLLYTIAARINEDSYILLKSQLLDMLNYSRFMPWKLNVNFPKDLTNLTKSQKRAYLYCASESENSEWLDFYDKEDEVDSLTNIILSIGKHQIENMILHRNLKASSLQIFEKLFAKLDKNIYR